MYFCTFKRLINTKISTYFQYTHTYIQVFRHFIFIYILAISNLPVCLKIDKSQLLIHQQANYQNRQSMSQAREYCDTIESL